VCILLFFLTYVLYPQLVKKLNNKRTTLPLAILFHFLCTQHVSDINPYPANVENMVSF